MATTTGPMSLEVLNWSDDGGFNVRVGLLRNTGVPAIEATGDGLLAKVVEMKGNDRIIDGLRRDVARIPETRRTAAIEAGVSGKKTDKKKLRRDEAKIAERLEDALLDRTELSAALYQARLSYLTSLSHHRPHLLSNARDIAEASAMSMASAREMVRRSASALNAAILVLGAAPMLEQGEVSPQLPKPPREGSDDLTDGGNPGVWASLADEPLVKAIGWTSRWVDHAKTLERSWTGEEPAAVEPAAEDDDEGSDE